MKRNENECIMGASPVLEKKRLLSPDVDTQMGSLQKHNTTLKEDQTLRRKLNYSFFTGVPGSSITSIEKKDVKSTAGRKTKKCRRRVNSQTRQTLITSAFSPRVKSMEEEKEKLNKDQNEVEDDGRKKDLDK